jgi:hypothetical protein
MKPIKIENSELYYTEVQVGKSWFWLITNDCFLNVGCFYAMYMQKELTLKQALEVFYTQNLDATNPKSRVNRLKKIKVTYVLSNINSI